jgi:hypothetical protein
MTGEVVAAFIGLGAMILANIILGAFNSGKLSQKVTDVCDGFAKADLRADKMEIATGKLEVNVGKLEVSLDKLEANVAKMESRAGRGE